MARKPDFDDELERLQRHLPAWARSMIQVAKRRDAWWVRLPLAIALMVGGVFGFLPILGFWMLPLGLAFLALDLQFLRRPLARVLAFVNEKLQRRQAELPRSAVASFDFPSRAGTGSRERG